jgi:predicted transcriptional regulator of viral defense system
VEIECSAKSFKFFEGFCMARSTRESVRALNSLANDQGGYFTAKQARAVGYDYPHLEYHLGAGNFERVAHGLYRLSAIPPAEHDELIRLTLWSRNQKDVPQAVVSHESALVLHELTELILDHIHLTVPPAFRKDAPRGCVLHKAVLEPIETEDRGGFRVTTPLRTLLDAATGSVSQEQLEKAVKDALSRGLVRARKLDELARRNLQNNRLLVAIKRTTRKRT